MNKTQLKQVIEEEFRKLLKEYKYKLYHKSFTSAAEEARKVAEKKGFEIDEENWTTEVAFGGKYKRARPSVGKSNSFSVALTKTENHNASIYTFRYTGWKVVILN